MATPDNTMIHENDIPYDELDKRIIPLVRALNEYPHIKTVGSCGGHENPASYQYPADRFYVTFTIESTQRGWRTLEFLAWAINNDYAKADHAVILLPYSPPPFLNKPGRCLHFAIEGHEHENPDELAAWLTKVRSEYFGDAL